MTDEILVEQFSIGFIIPKKARELLRDVMLHVQDYTQNPVAEKWWYVEIVSWSSQPLSKKQLEILCQPMSLAFTPTIELTHVGRSDETNCLWAYAAMSYPMRTIYALLVQRLSDLATKEITPCLPHITLATIKDNAPSLLADEILAMTFSVRDLVILERGQSAHDAEKNSPLGHVILHA